MKFRLPEKDQKIYVFECQKCQARQRFTVLLAEHLRTHTPIGGRCGGVLVFVEAETERR